MDVRERARLDCSLFPQFVYGHGIQQEQHLLELKLLQGKRLQPQTKKPAIRVLPKYVIISTGNEVRTSCRNMQRIKNRQANRA
jgi:hypothetical protein